MKEYFDSIKGNEDMKLFRSNRIDWALERAVSAYEKATHEKSGTKFEQNRFGYAAKAAIKLIARQAELGNGYFTETFKHK